MRSPAVPPLAEGSTPVTPEESGRPVTLVRVPEDGVPSAPLLSTGEPVEFTFTASAAAMPVPSPDTPEEIGNPVALVSVAEKGVPSAPPFVSSVAEAGMVVPLKLVTPESVEL